MDPFIIFIQQSVMLDPFINAGTIHQKSSVHIAIQNGSRQIGPRTAESEKPRRRVGIADRKVFARLESFCAYLENWPFNEP